MFDQKTYHTLILGVGNLLLSDEGLGVHVIQRIVKNHKLPEGVQVLDGGTLGLDLLYFLDGVKNLLIIDAVEMNKAPGTFLRMEGDEIPTFLAVKMSPHQIGIPDMLFAAKLRDLYPENVVLFGIQPKTLDVSTELSGVVDLQVPSLIEKTFDQLKNWGIEEV